MVLPLLDNDAKALVRLVNNIDCNYQDTILIDNPNAFFENIPVITISQAETAQNENRDYNGINLEGAIDISESTSGHFASGTAFRPYKDIDWFFIPFNYKQDERKKQFEKALNKSGLTLANIDIKENKNDIIKAYKDVNGDLNENSMVLFSGREVCDSINCFQHSHCFHHPHCSHHQHCFHHPHCSHHQHCFHYPDCSHHQHCFHHPDCFYHPHCFYGCHYFRLESGCLYMGDIDLTDPSIVRDLKCKLRSIISSIGTLQVPHHGSIHNFNESILHNNIRCAIFSYGTTNTYKHPSKKVISYVRDHKVYPHLVTEEQHSIVIQCN